MNNRESYLYEFGPYRLDPQERLLLRQGEPVALTPKAFETLVALVRRAGRLAEKFELIKDIWPDTFVEESNLAQNVFALRKALGEGENGEKYIETVPKRGYRFLAAVRVIEDDGDKLFIRQHVSARTRLHEANSLDHMARPGSVPVEVAKEDATGRLNIRTLAVLPLKLIGKHDDYEYLEIGMADTLIVKLSNIRRLKVRPTSAVLQYNSKERDPLGAARQLKVDAVLDGYIQVSGDRIRVTAQIVGPGHDEPLWAEQFEAPLTDIFAVQDAISEQLTRRLMLKLTTQELTRLKKHDTINIEAYHAYLKGQHYWNVGTAESGEKAIRWYEEAVRLDPGYALAYAKLADAYNYASIFTLIPAREAFVKIKEAATRALAIDGELAEAHAALAWAMMSYGWDWSAAERGFKRALEANPNYAIARNWYAQYLMFTKRFDEAVAEFEQAIRLDPLSPVHISQLAYPYFLSQRYEQCIVQCQKTLEVDANFYAAWFTIGWAYSLLGRHDEAIAWHEKGVAHPEGRAFGWTIGHAYALAGRREEARRALAGLQAVARQRYVSPYHEALIHVALGERDEAFACLERVYENGDPWAIWLNADPRVDDLRSDPRFTDLLRRVGFGP